MTRKSQILPHCRKASVRTYKKLYFWCYKVRADETEIESDEIEDFPFFCKIVLKPGGYAVIFAGLFMTNI